MPKPEVSTAESVPAPAPEAQAAQPSEVMSAGKDDPKRVAHILEIMEGRLEDFYYVNQRPPKDFSEFKAWRHPHLKLGDLDPWPEPPTGKLWVIKNNAIAVESARQ